MITAFLTYRIPVARIILASYTALVLVLALHHHHHGHATTPAIASPDASADGHHHAAADCPLFFYARYTFLAEPDEPPRQTVLPVTGIDVTDSVLSHGLLSRQFPLTRAPPILS